MARISCQKLVVRGEQQVKKPFVLPNPQISINENIQFVKKLTMVALSSIAYIRNIFPDDAFSTRKLDGMSVFVLKEIDEYPGTSKMLEWITSAFRVIDAKCLKKLILVVEDPQSNKQLETYSLNFTYDREVIHYALTTENDGLKEVLSQSKMECPADIKAAVSRLIRSIVTVIQATESLPNEYDVSMLLEFSADRLPDDFQIPKHFKTIDSLGIDFPPSIQKYKFGKVSAKYISMGITAKSLLTGDAQIDMEEEAGNGSNIQSQADIDEDIMPVTPENSECVSSLRLPVARFDRRSSQLTSTKLPELVPAAAATENACFEPVPPPVPLEAESTDLSESMSGINIKEVDCICKFEDREVECLKCSVCGTNQHKACYKILQEESVEQHVCVGCHQHDRPCTVPDIVTMDEKKRKTGALLRRAINLCISTPRISINSFTTNLPFSRTLAEKVFTYLDSEGCLHPATGKRNIRAVKVDHLKEHLVSKHFNVPHLHNDNSMDTEENPQFNKENSMALSNKRSRMDDTAENPEFNKENSTALSNKRIRMDDGDHSPNQQMGSRLSNKRLKAYAKSINPLSIV